MGIQNPKNNAPHREPRAQIHLMACITHLRSESKRYCTAKRQFSRQAVAIALKLVNDVSAAWAGLGVARKRVSHPARVSARRTSQTYPERPPNPCRRGGRLS